MHSPKDFFFPDNNYRETDLDKNKTETNRSVAKLCEFLEAFEK